MTISAVTFGATGAVGDPTSRYPSSWTIKFAVFMRVFASARKRRRPRTSTHASFAPLSPSYTTSWRAENRVLYPGAGVLPHEQAARLGPEAEPTPVTVVSPPKTGTPPGTPLTCR